jgi:ribose transport system substrate-binding protein
MRGGEHLQNTVVELGCLLDLAGSGHPWEKRDPDRLGGGRDLNVEPRGDAELRPCSEGALQLFGCRDGSDSHGKPALSAARNELLQGLERSRVGKRDLEEIDAGIPEGVGPLNRGRRLQVPEDRQNGSSTEARLEAILRPIVRHQLKSICSFRDAIRSFTMRNKGGETMRRLGISAAAFLMVLAACGGGDGGGGDGDQPQAVGAGGEKAQANCDSVAFEGDGTPRIAYMPPATEFPYYIAIGEGIKAKASELDAETFMLAPQSGADIEGQMGMIQDVLTQDVDGIILSTHDEQAAAPLVKQAVDAGIAVVIVNSDIADFPTPIHSVVGYLQRKGTRKIGEYAIGLVDGTAKIGVIEGLPGYHSKERVGGFLDAIEGEKGMEVVKSLVGDWNVEGGNRAGQDMLQANPDIEMIFAANDYMAIGADEAADGMDRDIIILGNDGDTRALEEIHGGDWQATVMTHPFQMGEQVLEVMLDCLNKELDGFFHEIPTVVVEKKDASEFLCHPESLHPKPSKSYECP